MRDAIGLAIQILVSSEAILITDGVLVLNGHACRQAGYVPQPRWAFRLTRSASSSRIDDQFLAIVLKRESAGCVFVVGLDRMRDV
jgi:hypothetical protein